MTLLRCRNDSRCHLFLLKMRTFLIIGLRCYSCYGISHPRFCDHVMTCVDGEVCGIQKFTDPSGDITFNTGCVSAKTCQQKRSGPNPTKTCVECCNLDICNIEGCGEHGHFNRTGLICYNCKGVQQNEQCQRVHMCDENESCYIEEDTNFGETFLNSGCRDKHICPHVINSKPIFGKRSSVDICSKCCDDDFCNSECRSSDECADKRQDCQYMLQTAEMCNNDDNESMQCRRTCGYCEPMGKTFYLFFSPNIVNSQLFFSSVRSGYCNITETGFIRINLTNKFAFKQLNSIKDQHFKVNCDIRVHLYVLERRSEGVDGYISLPVEYYSNSYLIPSYNPADSAGKFLGIVGTQNDTYVSISLKEQQDTSAFLDQGTVWYVYYIDKIDMSGSFINASKPIGVFSNIACTTIDPSCSPFSDMVIPLRDYSKNFIIPHFPGIQNGLIRVYFKGTCEVISFDTSLSQSVVHSVGDKNFVEIAIHSGNITSLTSTCMATIQMYGPHSSPFMVLIPGVDKYLPQYHFAAPDNSELLITIPSSHVSDFRLDGSKLGTPLILVTFNVPFENREKYAIFSVQVKEGSHKADTVTGISFGLWIYGDGFAFPAGYRMPLN